MGARAWGAAGVRSFAGAMTALTVMNEIRDPQNNLVALRGKARAMSDESPYWISEPMRSQRNWPRS